MNRKMLVNAADPEEVRVAVLDEGVLQEFYIERAARETLVGNIYKGRVINIVFSLQAAFVDIGLGKNAFLHASEVVAPHAAPAGPARTAGQSPPPDTAPGTDTARRGPERHDRRPTPDLREALRPGQEILVQVTRDPVGDKGPSVSMDISIPGRYLVLTPQTRRFAVSRRIPDPAEREALKSLLTELDPPPDVGFIVRTAGTGQARRDLQRDLDGVVRLWRAVSEKAAADRAPVSLYTDSDLVIRTIRDLFTPEVEEVHIDSPSVLEKTIEFVSAVMPRFRGRFLLYEEAEPLFHKFGVETQIEGIYSKRVELPGGGSIVIEQTEALTAVDVNSGRTAGATPEEMALRTNLEACEEIGRQLRLRDIGGVIVIDFIDVKESEHRREVERAMKEVAKKDRSQTTILRMSRLGLLELAREKIRPGVKRLSFEECRACRGTGLVKSVESMGLWLLRLIRHELNAGTSVALEVRMNPDVAQYILNVKRKDLLQLEERYGRGVALLGEVGFEVERYELSRVRAEG
ncbi:MAG: Rne/Rng family ribonuclease [Candidatus Brocadiae bacterium]|nr:Rne/Rng family ribonuclease [Candidatus Brocadiia bacterium]